MPHGLILLLRLAFVANTVLTSQLPSSLRLASLAAPRFARRSYVLGVHRGRL